MKRILFYSSEYESEATEIIRQLNLEKGEVMFRSFPDQESLVRIDSDVENKEVIVLYSLFQPNSKVVDLLFFAETAKSLNAGKVTLVVPYLPYMRQDKSFHKGEGVNAIYFGKLLSNYFDKIVTIDPHLHRILHLSEVYSCDTVTLHAGETIGNWIKANIKDPILIGPDGESKQWVESVAKVADAPFLVLTKERFGDEDVKISIPHIEKYKDKIPVVVDDIISSGITMVDTALHLQKYDYQKLYAVAIHGIFANGADEKMVKAGFTDIITLNTIKHPSNKMDMIPLLIQGIE